MSAHRLLLPGFVIFFFLLISIPPPSAGESVACLAVYREGGAPAVFQSPKCPRWTLLPDHDHQQDPRTRRLRPPPPLGCHLAIHQGRRRSQEDRAFCSLDIRIPFLGRAGIKEMSVGLVAVFDGHNGAEASDMASKLLLEYFLLHVYFLLDGIYSMVMKRSDEKLTYGGEESMIFQVLNLDEGKSWHSLDPERMKWISTMIFDGQFHMEILKESLLRTIHDIDSTFSKEAFRQNLESGSTATVVLIADGRILVANIGDSKAILCSENIHSHNPKGNVSKLSRQRRHKGVTMPVNKLVDSNGISYLVKELTEDHHPDRDDERNRVEAAGGYVVEWAGVVRVNGELAVSRSIGDVIFKSYGVISTPEVTDWQSLMGNDSYLVVASDGIFEKMTTQEVCNLLLDENQRVGLKSEADFIPTISDSFADYIISTAFERGSMDNMAAVVVPLQSAVFSGWGFKDECDLQGSFDLSSYGPQKIVYKKPDDYATTTSLVSLEFFNQIMTRFNRLLVEAKYKRLGCFYLSESLDEDMDYVFRAPKEYRNDDAHDIAHALPESFESYLGMWPPDLYDDHKLCLHFPIEGDKGQCTSPEVFAKLLGLLDSIPHNESMSSFSESFGHKIPEFRYILKRRFDRGSYGEVWLAFHWNCYQNKNAGNQMHKNPTHFANDLHFDRYKCNASVYTNSSDKDCSTDSSDGNLFILKRIMVERGTTAYLSGLREKYFGEIFLNASRAQRSLTVTKLSTSSVDIHDDFSDLLATNVSAIDDMDSFLNPMVLFPGNFRGPSVSYEEGLEHIARYIESFESEAKEIWLVFQNEGISLSKLIYTVEETKSVTNDGRDEQLRNIQVLHPSSWWHWLRKTEAGQKELQNIIWQLLMALKSCHDRNITHRDIKPENMIVCFEEVDTGRCSREIPSGDKQYNLKLRIIDFGSAIDEFSMKYLYGSGPSRSEQTFEYTPPEALLNASWFHGPRSAALKYDMWSVGVVMLELILGSPHVFQISDRTRALLDQHLDGWSEHTKELAYKLRAYMEMCILIPGISPLHHQGNGRKSHDGVWPASWKCSEEFFSGQVRSRDPLGLGFPNVWALRLVRQLLMWHPEDRLNIDEALHHPYFQKHPHGGY